MPSVEDLKIFSLLPVLRSLVRGEKFTQQWKARNGWVASSTAGKK